ncbi:MAG: hypothetical protein AB1513_08950 [Pseudomonadota bacterium]
MEATYNYLVGATLVDVINDIRAILTGETNTANLSAGCDTNATSISQSIASAGWLLHDRCAEAVGTSTITIANPAVINKGTSSGLANGMPVMWTTTGALPSPFVAGTVYYVTNVGASTCNLSATVGGAAIDTTGGSQSGTHTLYMGRKCVLKAPVHDDQSQSTYIYAQLDYSSAGFMQMHLFETWNNSTHAGTLQANAFATTKQQRLSVGAGTTRVMSLWAGAGKYLVAQSAVDAGIGASEASQWTGIFQRSRLSPWDTLANGYPPAILTNGSDMATSVNAVIAGYAPRYKNPAGGDLTGANASLKMVMMGFVSGNGGGINVVGTSTGVISDKVPDGAGDYFAPANEIQFRSPANLFPGGSISTVCDVWMGPSYVSNKDKMKNGAGTYSYRFIQNTSTAKTATGNLALPMG